MFKEQYKELNKQVHPDTNLITDTMKQVRKIEIMQQKKFYAFRKPAIAFVTIFFFLSLVMPTLAGTVEPIYQLMYLVSPTIAQYFMPIQRSVEDNGIKMKVVSSSIHGNLAEIYITLQDLTADRIDETIDFLDSYSINRPFNSSARCERVGYDKSTKKATFLITIEEWGTKNISGDKITFSVREFISHKKIYNGEIPISLSEVDTAKETQIISNITGGSTDNSENFSILENEIIGLISAPPMDEFPVKGIDFTGIGYIDGKLHIQTAVKDNLGKDNHGYFYLKDSFGNKINSSYSFNFVNHYDPPGRIDYCNDVFDVPQSDIINYTLYGHFVTSGESAKGNWNITFPLH